MSIDLETGDARAPLRRFLRQHYPAASIPEDASVSDLAQMARPFGRGDPILERQIRLAQDQEEQRKRNGRTADAMAAQTRALIEQRFASKDEQLVDVLGQVVAELRLEWRDDSDELRAKIADLEKQLSFAAQFREMEMRNVEREERRNEARRGPTGRQGQRGARGERGATGARGPAGKPAAALPKLIGWKLDRERFEVWPMMSDGSDGSSLSLRPLFVRFLEEVDLERLVDEAIAKAMRKQS